MKLKAFFSFLLIITAYFHVWGQEPPQTFKNPIISGYHPDPSICRVGDDYYLVNSSFVWFPGLPIYHSKDLVNWEQIGNAVSNPESVNFDGLKDRLGLFAPTIRHHEGVFYIINTCVGCKMNFYITAENPAGPWSDPIWLPQATGIDPSLFWDDDGKVYYTGTGPVKEKQWATQTVVYNQEIDLNTNQLIGKRHELTNGHANNASYTEGPHIYKINGRYLLLVSEGGTEENHAMSVHHSDNINGPYVADIVNPVFTHRHLGKDYPTYAIGHGDLVQTQNGEWWAVMLGKRWKNGITTLARETFLAKVNFEGQTPIFNKGKGVVLSEQERPDLPWTPVPALPVVDQFDKEQLAFKWCTIRTPKSPFYELENGTLKVKLRKEVMNNKTNSSILIQRLVDHDFEASTHLSFKTSKQNEHAGLTIYRTNENHFKLMKEKNTIVLIETFKGIDKEIARIPYKQKEVIFKAAAKDMMVQFYYGNSTSEMHPIGDKRSLIIIADEQGNAKFNGAGIGVYATSNGIDSKNEAVYDWFSLEGLKANTEW
ncbi:glycoside hydrolase family 43 protein [Flammeovirga sp. EKP202]|uniref:glycoside hydrolase family 43 protein n=1 Tax=Flammeovirga sp. EKP202 TaxID=2770592 RepID=UPI00165F38D0|nr:glycoside hydrolase family 43 protein [Flammeovirga sp. EKP202]MBD0401549.1 glycoside hydrolase family 43 protein [Flammeovirga sp. EKP202]